MSTPIPKWMRERGITPPAPPPKPVQRIEGLGDVVDIVTTYTGVKRAVKWWTGGNCGCEKRRRRLNALVPFRRST